jgi:hypothetical protein
MSKLRYKLRGTSPDLSKSGADTMTSSHSETSVDWFLLKFSLEFYDACTFTSPAQVHKMLTDTRVVVSPVMETSRYEWQRHFQTKHEQICRMKQCEPEQGGLNCDSALSINVRTTGTYAASQARADQTVTAWPD